MHQRIRNWRDFREKIKDLNEEEQLQETVKYWSKTPFVMLPVLDWDDTGNWPNAWELVNEGEYCRSGISLLIGETLKCLNWNSDRIEYLFLQNTNDNEMHYAVLIDSKRIFNYDLYEELNIDKLSEDFVILNRVKSDL